jgi:HEAT repeat protein
VALEKSESGDRQRTAFALLRQSEPAIERLFDRLEEEQNALIRFRIMRLAGQLREAGIASVVKRLGDERWYVVRNSCLLLGEMRDPDAIVHLAPALRHPDERVQRAAFQTLQKSRLTGCVRVYADALAELAPAVLEPALDEIMLGRDRSCVAGLCRLVTQGGPDRSRFAARAVQIAVALDSAACVALLGEAVKAPGISEVVRSLLRRASGRRR